MRKRSLLRVHTKNKDSGTVVGASGSSTRSITTDTTMTGTPRVRGGRGAMTNTWLGLEDLPDPAPKVCSIEADQADYLKQSLTREGSWGELEFWDWLEEIR